MRDAEVSEKPSAWSAGIKNGLNARVSFRRSTIVSTGPYETEKAEWSLELDVPTGVTVDEVQDDLEDELDGRAARWRSKFASGRNDATAAQAQPSSSPTSTSKPAPQSPQTKPLEHTQPQSTSIPTPTQKTDLERSIIAAPLDIWKPQTKSGDYCIASQIPKLADALRTADKKSLIVSEYRYSLWEGSNHLERISRWAHRRPS